MLARLGLTLLLKGNFGVTYCPSDRLNDSLNKQSQLMYHKGCFRLFHTNHFTSSYKSGVNHFQEY